MLTTSEIQSRRKHRVIVILRRGRVQSVNHKLSAYLSLWFILQRFYYASGYTEWVSSAYYRRMVPDMYAHAGYESLEYMITGKYGRVYDAHMRAWVVGTWVGYVAATRTFVFMSGHAEEYRVLYRDVCVYSYGWTRGIPEGWVKFKKVVASKHRVALAPTDAMHGITDATRACAARRLSKVYVVFSQESPAQHTTTHSSSDSV